MDSSGFLLSCLLPGHSRTHRIDQGLEENSFELYFEKGGQGERVGECKLALQKAEVESGDHPHSVVLR